MCLVEVPVATIILEVKDEIFSTYISFMLRALRSSRAAKHKFFTFSGLVNLFGIDEIIIANSNICIQ